MNVVGIVVLALISGLFLAILLAGVGLLIWTNLRLQKVIVQTQSELQNHQTSLMTFLASHKSELTSMISKINGDELAVASKSILSSASRIEKACIAFGELAKYMLADRDTIASNGAGLKPDEFATPEPGERFVSYTQTSSSDQAAALEEE